MNGSKKNQTIDIVSNHLKISEEDWRFKLDNLNRALSAYFAISKRLIDLDDAIDIEGIEFDPNIDDIEWQSIRATALIPQKLQKQIKTTNFSDCVAKNRKVYEILHDKEFIFKVLKCR